MQLKGEAAGFAKRMTVCTDIQNLKGWQGWFASCIEMKKERKQSFRVVQALHDVVSQRLTELTA